MRRQRASEGFVLAEALVALAIAAMTIALLTSASWGLRMASERQQAAAATSAADWLAARRALSGWAASVTANSAEQSPASFFGTATLARMTVPPGAGGPGTTYVAELSVRPLGDGRFALVAARHLDRRDARTTSDTPQETTLLETADPIRLLYLLPREGGLAGQRWRYETGNGDDGLPSAIGVEVGNQRMLTAGIPASIGATCLGARGPGAIDADACALR